MNNLKLFEKLFFITLGAIIFFEFLSLLAFSFPLVNNIGFFLILFISLILSFWRLEYGIYFVLAELIIGSKGYLFSWEIKGIDISIRLGLFLVVFAIGIIKSFLQKRLDFKHSSLFKWYLLLLLAIAFGIFNGYLKKNSLSNIFFDFNGWLFFGLAFVFINALDSWEKIKKVLQIIFAATTALILKTIFLIFVFSHKIPDLMYGLYKWVRQTGVGEITQMPNNFYRIFFQSHVFAIFIFFLIALLLIRLNKNDFAKKDYYGYWLIGIFTSLVTFTSYSRSFWLGAIFGIIALYYFIFFVLKISLRKAMFISGYLISSFVIVYVITLGIVKFPWPSPSGFTGGLIEERTTDITTEAGAASRFQLLKPLAYKIKENPLLGLGFGTTITYQTKDPRFLETHPDGMYTTYAFEWSYLDIWLKLGLIGLIIYLLFLYKLFREGWLIYKKSENQPLIQTLALGLLLGLLVLLTINVTTPYLNHPLGIGYLLFTTAVFITLQRTNEQIK